MSELKARLTLGIKLTTASARVRFYPNGLEGSKEGYCGFYVRRDRTLRVIVQLPASHHQSMPEAGARVLNPGTHVSGGSEAPGAEVGFVTTSAWMQGLQAGLWDVRVVCIELRAVLQSAGSAGCWHMTTCRQVSYWRVYAEHHPLRWHRQTGPDLSHRDLLLITAL